MTTARRFFFVTWAVAVMATVGYAQSVTSVISRHYTTDEGLPSNNVMCAQKDHDGFLWFGTWYGLCRFDGDKFKSYNQQLSARSAIPPRKVETIVEDASGNLWLKTVDWKLYVFNRRTECFHAVYDELKRYTHHLQVIKIQRTDEGQVVMLTKDKTLLLGDTNLHGDVQLTKLFDSTGHIDTETLQLQHDVTVTRKGFNLFIGRDYRIFIQRMTAKKSLETAMADDDNHQHQHTAHLMMLAHEANISKFSQLYMDSDSLLWVTTNDKGVYCISKPANPFTFITLPGEDMTGVRCIYQTRQRTIIVGTRSRNVYLFDTNGELRQTLSYADYGIGAVYHAMEDSKGRLWLSTKGDGLVIIDAQESWKKAVHYRHEADNPASISGNNVYMTFTDSQQHVWVCTLDGGLNLVQEKADGTLTFYHKNHGFKHYPAYGLYTEVRNITEDQYGHIWVGTIDGLMSFDSHFDQPQHIAFKTYHHATEGTFANNDINTLHRSRNGQVWVGAFGGGLARMVENRQNEGLRFDPLGVREGLRNDVIISMTEDLQGHLWFATEAGLSCYNQETGRIRNFDRYDGMPSVKMEESSAACSTDGRLWVGCRQGLLTFRPEQLQTSQRNYKTFILELVTDNQAYSGPTALPYAPSVKLEHDQNAFTVEFAALNYQNHGNVNYRYRLDGFDRDWRYSGIHRVGSYNEVPPGNYTFIVEAIDDANPALHSTARLPIRILSPWWATWWAYLIYLIVIALIACIVIRTILQMNRMRNEIYISQRLAKLTTKSDDSDAFIDRLHHIIRENISNSDFNIDAIASEMGLSRSAFYKKVKGQTGFAPVDLIKEFRLSHAAELLRTSSQSITEIAYESGFKDAGYFGKCFRKRYGMSPREYVHQE